MTTPSPDLDQLIRDEIVRMDGAISFERFMELALYAPGLGYYVRDAAAIGERGDFVTAPEMTSLFGAAIARQAEQVLGTVGGGIVELGPGTGKLALDLLNHLPESSWPEHYTLVERSPALKRQQAETLAVLPDALRARVRWLDQVPETNGLLLGNEVLDALSVERFELTDDGIRPLLVAATSEGFDYAGGLPAAELSDWWAELCTRLPEPPTAPYRSERCPALEPALADWVSPLERGVVLMLDYGYPEREYYHWDRRDGTLLCHFQHRAHGDALANAGLQDITASVDFTAAARALRGQEFEIAGFCSQAWFLLGCGIESLLAEQQSGPAQEALASVQAVKRLLLPGEMGDRVQVLAASRGCDIDLQGFALKDQRARLAID